MPDDIKTYDNSDQDSSIWKTRVASYYISGTADHRDDGYGFYLMAEGQPWDVFYPGDKLDFYIQIVDNKNKQVVKLDQKVTPDNLREIGEMFLRAAYRLQEKGF